MLDCGSYVKKEKIMIALIFRSLCLFATLCALPLCAEEPQNIDNPNIQHFHQQLQLELAKAKQYLANQQKRATDRSLAPAYIDKVAFQNAIVMLNTKTTLYNNFYNNPVNADPEVRRLVIALMQKEMITEGDLSALQNAADQAREKMRRTNQVPANQYRTNPDRSAVGQ